MRVDKDLFLNMKVRRIYHICHPANQEFVHKYNTPPTQRQKILFLILGSLFQSYNTPRVSFLTFSMPF